MSYKGMKRSRPCRNLISLEDSSCGVDCDNNVPLHLVEERSNSRILKRTKRRKISSSTLSVLLEHIRDEDEEFLSPWPTAQSASSPFDHCKEEIEEHSNPFEGSTSFTPPRNPRVISCSSLSSLDSCNSLRNPATAMLEGQQNISKAKFKSNATSMKSQAMQSSFVETSFRSISPDDGFYQSKWHQTNDAPTHLGGQSLFPVPSSQACLSYKSSLPTSSRKCLDLCSRQSSSPDSVLQIAHEIARIHVFDQ